MKLAKRSEFVKGSPTLALAAQAIEMKSQGVDVVSLSVGEPDWQSFDVCVEAGIQAIKEGKTRYTPASGTKDLKDKLANKFSKRFGLDLEASNVIVTPGAKYALQQALWNLVNSGEQVGIFVPYWASYSTMVEIADGKPHFIELNTDFSLNAKTLKKALESGVKVLLINSPNNPSGAVWSKSDYKTLVETLKPYPDVQIILDDIYAELYWGQEEACPHLLDVAPDFFDRCVLVNGASKAFSMTGWRIGWAIGGKDIIGALSRYQSQTTGCPNSMAQWATAAGISHAEDLIKKSSKILKERSLKGEELLSQIQGVQVYKPEAAFYFWVNLSEILTKLNLTDKDFCSRLLSEKAVVVVPGTDFGQPGFIRMSFAVSSEVLAEGVRRLEDFIKSML